jgi:hypothetical protein
VLAMTNPIPFFVLIGPVRACASCAVPLGPDLRAVFATSGGIEGVSADADYVQGSFFIGFGF